MAGRKSSFLMRTRKVKEGERVELTHLESQATGRFSSLDEATAWLRAKWLAWDARPAETEDAPAMPAERAGGMRRLWDNAWTSQGLRRGEALVLATAVLVLSIVAGNESVRGALGAAGDNFGSTALFAGAPSTCIAHDPTADNFRWGSLSFRVKANTAGRTDGSFTMGPDVTLEPVLAPAPAAAPTSPEVVLYKFQTCNVLVDGGSAVSLEMSAATPMFTLHKGDVFVACINFRIAPAFSQSTWAAYNPDKKAPKVTISSGDAVAGAYVGSPSPLPNWGSLASETRCGVPSDKRMILWAYGRGLTNPVFPQDVVIKIEFGSFNWRP